MAQELKVLIVDDEPLAQELVAGYVRKVPFLELAGCCSTAAEADDVLRSTHIDLMFIDIQMPGVSGLTFAKSLEGNERPKIVFTTAYSEYAVEGFKCDAIDYLLKPFDFEEFSKAANKAKKQIELERAAEAEGAENDAVSGDETFFFVRSDYKLVKIEYEKICYVEGLKDYVKIYLIDRSKAVLTLSTMKQLESRLERFSFVRIHRSYIVNVKMISGVERAGIYVGSVRLPIGDGYKAKVQDVLERLTL